jgi:vitamin K-dependent gamma-carboxylase
VYYLNHLYLVCLLAFVAPWLPAHRAFSVDARLVPGLRADRVSGWALFLLRAFFCQVYAFAGIAKLNPDWLRAQPLLTWLEARGDMPIVGPLLAWDPTAWAMSYAGLAFDLCVGPALWCRRTRPYAIAAAFLFHGTNAFLFEIGIFPWLMMASTLLFLDPSWPRRLPFVPAASAVAAAMPGPRARVAIAGALGAWFAVHTALPLRHWLFPGDVAWTEEGHLFSWRMKLRSKEGRARFRVVDAETGEVWSVSPAKELPSRIATRLATQPDMILQYAHHLAERAHAEGRERVAVYADVRVRLNGRRPQRLVDPHVDLAAEPRSLRPASWILPLEEPLPGWTW